METMNRQKLTQLIIDKRNSRGETQKQFAEYFSELAGEKLSYGFIQGLENKDLNSIPEWGNMKAIAKMYNVNLAELDLYLEDDSITDIKDITSAYQTLSQNITPDLLIQITKDKMPIDEWGKIGLTLIQDAFNGIKEKIEKADSIMQLFQKINPERI
jgi:transcriptional regulator with XRE-family HTH domain